MILGMDADTFELNGGDDYYKQARDIVSYSQQTNSKGWAATIGGDQTRNVLIIHLSPTFKEFRSVCLSTTYKGMDLMADNVKEARQQLLTALSQLENLHRQTAKLLFLRVFFDAKADEISDFFLDGLA